MWLGCHWGRLGLLGSLWMSFGIGLGSREKKKKRGKMTWNQMNWSITSMAPFHSGRKRRSKGISGASTKKSRLWPMTALTNCPSHFWENKAKRKREKRLETQSVPTWKRLRQNEAQEKLQRRPRKLEGVFYVCRSWTQKDSQWWNQLIPNKRF